MIHSAVLIQYTCVTDGRTDGIGVAYTRYSIYAVAHKNWNKIYKVVIVKFPRLKYQVFLTGINPLLHSSSSAKRQDQNFMQFF